MHNKSQQIENAQVDSDETKNNDSPGVYNYFDFRSLGPSPITKEITLYVAPIGNAYRISAVDSETRQRFESDPISRATKIWIIKDHDDFFCKLKRLDKIDIIFPIDERYNVNVLTDNTFNLEDVQAYYKDFDPEELTDEFGLTRATIAVQISPFPIQSAQNSANIPYPMQRLEFEPNPVNNRQNEQFHLFERNHNAERLCWLSSRLFCAYCCLIPLSACTRTIATIIQGRFFAPSPDISNTLSTLNDLALDEETQIQSPMQRF